MATQEQIEANRRNLRRSTGPKTPEGKATVNADSGAACGEASPEH